MANPFSLFANFVVNRSLLGPAILLISPIFLALWFWLRSRRGDGEYHAAVWLSFRRLSRLVMPLTLAGWWAIWDSSLLSGRLPDLEARLSGWFDSRFAEILLFSSPPILSLGTFLLLAYAIDGVVLKLKWTIIDVLRQAWWRLISFVVPLLMIAIGVDEILRGDLWGCSWIVLAGVIAVVGLVFLRRAEGMKMHEVKASETRNRAFKIAKRMGVKLQRIYVVPAGRGHLTNAFGGGSMIALTDNLGKYLSKREIDSVIAHELGHVAEKHGRKRLLGVAAIYATTTILLYLFRENLIRVRPLVAGLVMLVPLTATYCLSRWHEYEADRREVEFTRDPETAIRALAALYRISGAPLRRSKITEIFATHPNFEKRAEAMGRTGEMPVSRVAQILRDEGIDGDGGEREAVQ